jgi:nitrite reductase/ring-hydroxylating ferredoxin subunit
MTDNSNKVWVKACPLADLPTDKAANIFVNGQRFVIMRANDKAYMFQGYCSHMLYPLKDSKVQCSDDKGCELVCNLHSSRFNLADGSVAHWATPASAETLERKALRTFETRIEDGMVYIEWAAASPDKVRVKF